MTGADGTRGGSEARDSPRRRLAVLLALLVAPWTVVLVGGDVVTVIFLPGLVDVVSSPAAVVPSVHAVGLWELFAAGGGLPRNPELWPASVLLYLAGLASAASGALFDREDARVTASLCLLAAAAHLGVAYAFSHRPAYVPFPVAPVVLAGVVVWYYGPALRAAVLAPVADD